MPFYWRIALVAALMAGAYGVHAWDRYNAVQEATGALEAMYANKLLEANVKALETEKHIREGLIKDIEKKDNDIKAISRKLDNALSSLQHYKPCSSTDNTNTARNISPCPGRELSREDAEFLAREAARADEVVAERDFYYGQYERAREALAPR